MCAVPYIDFGNQGVIAAAIAPSISPKFQQLERPTTGTRLKNKMGRLVVADDAIQAYANKLFPTGQWYLGLIIGQVFLFT